MVSPNEDRTTVQAVSRRPLEEGFGFESRTVYMGFIADRLVIGRGFLRILRVSAVSIIPPVVCIHVSFVCQGHYIILAIESDVV